MKIKTLRKSLPKTYSMVILPSDETIDWKKTAEKITNDEEHFSVIHRLSYPDLSLEEVKKKYITNASKKIIYSYYKENAKFSHDFFVPVEGQELLKYVFEDFTISDLSILSKNNELTQKITEKISNSIVSDEDGRVLLNSSAFLVSLNEILQDISNVALLKKAIKDLLDAKLVKVLNADEMDREDLLNVIVESLGVEDVSALFSFIQNNIKLNVEKKNISIS